MEKILFEQYGIAGIILLLAAKFIWDVLKSKNKESSDAIKYNTIAVKELTLAIDKMKEQLAEIPKLKTDMKRSFLAHKILAGDKWSEIRKEIMEDI